MWRRGGGSSQHVAAVVGTGLGVLYGWPDLRDRQRRRQVAMSLHVPWTRVATILVVDASRHCCGAGPARHAQQSPVEALHVMTTSGRSYAHR